MTLFNRQLKLAAASCLLGAAVVSLTSCEKIYDDLDPCPHGVTLHFVYDYNMEFANAFPSQVDCITVLFYDQDGKYVTTRTNVNREELRDLNYRMRVELAPGSYTIVAYGGMETAESSFHFVNDPATTTLSDNRVALNADCITEPKGTNLHPLFYGDVEVVIDNADMEYREYTVPMMKDTNNLRIILQQVNGTPLNEKDFEFTITDNNTLFNWDNDLIPQPYVTYYPWTTGHSEVGVLPDSGISTVCWAELSIPRLVTGFKPILTITRKSDGEKIVNIPLNNYLLLLKSEMFSDMSSQEFLDRESRWSMIFFLDDSNNWLQTRIVINDWVVRLENVDFNI